MKKTKAIGIAALVLAAALVLLDVAMGLGNAEGGLFAGRLTQARAHAAHESATAQAEKSVLSLEKKIATATGKLEGVEAKVDAQIEAMDALTEALQADATGDADVDALRAVQQALLSALGDESAAAEGLGEGLEKLDQLTQTRVLALYEACVQTGWKAVTDAEGALETARDGADRVYTALGRTSGLDPIETSPKPTVESQADCAQALDALKGRAAQLEALQPEMDLWLQDARGIVQEAAAQRCSLLDRALLFLADDSIGVLFTAAILLIAGVVLCFFSESFARSWRKTPVFSVGMALVVMLILQTYALGFRQGSAGAWAKFWLDNLFNVLRANSSVGMIALGMTLVIITGGIDLAVGSTLAGVGTILMTLLDTGDRGVLQRIGLTGLPAAIVGILAALVCGLAIGSVIGLLITKGRVPPFIVTLGLMNVVRSVAQYFTKSYTPTVPKSFQAIANAVVLGQRPMTILYWAVLIVLFWLVMNRTVFGRYVYAVGSNERTTRLSGIDTDRVKMRVYQIMGAVVAVAAVAQLSRLGGMDVASAGNGYELDAIAAVVVGGTAMSGGKGSIIGTVLGVLIIGIMNNLLILLGVDAFLTDAFKGAIVVLAVLMQRKEARS